MPGDVGDDLQSMSFGSSDRSGSETVSTASGSSAADHCLETIRRLRSDSGSGGGGGGGGISMDDLRLVRRLGSGDIGSVYLAEVKKGRCLVAAKVMDKKELAERSKEGRARTEREILRLLDHPFLPHLYACVETDRCSCLLTEFCPGGDLYVLRQRQPAKRFDEPAVRFYASEVVVALEYIHMLGIVYRDLKPENVLIRSDGHIMLTDFDLSLKCDGPTATPAQLISNADPLAVKPLRPCGGDTDGLPTPFAAGASCILPSCIVPAVPCLQRQPNYHRRRKKAGQRGAELEFVAEPVELRSMSFVGTHEYLAPEIVSGEGHGSSVDWWTLGVFIFELLYGVTPFKGPDNELTLANIVARALEFPKEPPVSAAAKDLIAGLLAKDPAKRLGSTMGAAAIKRHPFFNGVSWALLRCAVPPYLPPPFTHINSGDSGDVSDDSCPGTPVAVEYY